MRSPSWVTWPILAALLVLFTGSLSASVLGDPDTMWHIAAGRWMVEQHQLPHQDMFSWSMPGTPWTAHEWLSELLLYGIHALGGFQGIVALAAVSFALLAAHMTRFFCDRMEPVHALPVAVIFIAVVGTHYLARPHVLVWPLMGWWIALLVEAVDQRRLPPWWVLGLLLLWANLHASFTLGLGMAGGLALDAIVSEETTNARWQRLKAWAGFGTGCLLAVALNPNGLGTLGHALQMMQMKEMLAAIGEWRSADFHQLQLVLFWIVLVFGLALMGRLRLSPVRALLVLGLFYMALKHARYHSTLALASTFLLAAPLGAALRSLRPSPSDAAPHGLDVLMRRLTAPAHPGAMMLAIVVAGSWIVGARALMPSAPPAALAPAQAVAAMQNGGHTEHLMNAYRFGGYLIFRRIPVFIDGRADMYGDPRIKEFQDAVLLREPNGLTPLLEKYGIRTTLLDAKAPAVAVLDHLQGWERIYSDSVAIVHVKRGADPRTP